MKIDDAVWRDRNDFVPEDLTVADRDDQVGRQRAHRLDGRGAVDVGERMLRQRYPGEGEKAAAPLQTGEQREEAVERKLALHEADLRQPRTWLPDALGERYFDVVTFKGRQQEIERDIAEKIAIKAQEKAHDGPPRLQAPLAAQRRVGRSSAALSQA